MPPTLAAGKLAYLLITVPDIERAARFYAEVLGWRVARKDDGRTAFDDGCGEVSGHWVAGQPPAGPPDRRGSW
ncbi:VOC family protein [Pseudonocardia sp.]|uniref:VOC family protein n=1 Tax=Pseudonocardia sp. TaxID=60912 RepID=UPI003D11A840